MGKTIYPHGYTHLLTEHTSPQKNVDKTWGNSKISRKTIKTHYGDKSKKAVFWAFEVILYPRYFWLGIKRAIFGMTSSQHGVKCRTLSLPLVDNNLSTGCSHDSHTAN